MAELDKLKELAAYVGFQSGTPAKEREGESVVDSSVDLLDVALWNELGTATAPSRPFLRQSVDNNKDKINAFCQAQLKALRAYVLRRLAGVLRRVAAPVLIKHLVHHALGAQLNGCYPKAAQNLQLARVDAVGPGGNAHPFERITPNKDKRRF